MSATGPAKLGNLIKLLVIPDVYSKTSCEIDKSRISASADLTPSSPTLCVQEAKRRKLGTEFHLSRVKIPNFRGTHCRRSDSHALRILLTV